MDILVIGLGSMGKRRIRLLKRFNCVNNIIGVDSRIDRRAEISTTEKCQVFADLDQAIQKNPAVECAFICTSPLSHSALITQALEYNLNVFSEINLISEGYEHNIELSKQKNKVLFLSSTFFYREEIKYIRKNLNHMNNLNYIYHVGQYLPTWHPWENYKDFFVGSVKTNGCREIMAIELPWIINTFGDVCGIEVWADNISKLDIPYKDNYMIHFTHTAGHKGILIIDVVAPHAVRNLEIYGENTHYTWNGTPLGLSEYSSESQQMELVKFHTSMEHVNGYSSMIIEDAYQNEIEEFFNVVYNKATPKYGFQDDLYVLNLIDRIEAFHE